MLVGAVNDLQHNLAIWAQSNALKKVDVLIAIKALINELFLYHFPVKGSYDIDIQNGSLTQILHYNLGGSLLPTGTSC